MALSKRFRWVEVNRDHVPAIPKQFQVSAYPSLIVIGRQQEKIYRFQSYMPPAELLGHLREGLRRYALYERGEPWDRRPPRPATICDGAAVQTLKAPSEDQPGGIVALGGKLFVAQGQKLYRVDLQTGRADRGVTLPRPARGLATDGRYVYAIDYGWTAGKPIYVFDPRRGEVVREIITEANLANRYLAASGIVFVGERLFVLARNRELHEVDPRTGRVKATRQLPERAWKLAFDGKHLVTATHVSARQQFLAFLDPQTLKVVRKVPLNYGVSAIECHDGAVWLMEQPVRGFDTAHKRVRIYPDQMLIHQVRLKPPEQPLPTTPRKSR